MGFRTSLARWIAPKPPVAAAPRAQVQPAGGGTLITTPQELEQYLRAGNAKTNSGAVVTPQTAMGVAACYACVRIISGTVANMPLAIKLRIDERTRQDAVNDPLWKLLCRKPNSWQTPSGFRRLLTVHVLLRGNGYAYKVRSAGRIIGLIPMSPDRVTCKQLDDQSIVYEYTRPNGARVTFLQAEVFHLMGLSLNGITGVTPITYAREAIGSAIQAERHGASVFRNGALPGAALKSKTALSDEARDNLKAGLEEFRLSENPFKTIVLEEDLDLTPLTMTSEDMQYIETRSFTRGDIAMFFGVPPHMIGDTEKSTSFGTGLESQTQGYITFGVEDYLTAWEETIARDLIADPSSSLYARLNRAALVRGALAARWASYVQGLQWGVYSPNEVRAMEDMNPREGGDVYYDPPNTAGGENKLGHNGGPPLEDA